MIVETIVNTIAIMPALLVLAFLENKYLIPGHSPSGGSKMLTR
jgi:hypothetical protein